MKSPNHFLFPALLLCALIISGCGQGYTAIRARDNDVFFPTVRVNFPLSARESHGVSDLAVELNVSRARGGDSRAISETEILALNRTTFSGPTDIQQKFNMDAASAIFRFRSPRHISPAFMELVAGVLYTDVDLRLQSGAVEAEEEFRDGGTIVGLGVGYRFTDDFILDLRYVAEVLPFNLTRSREVKTTDLSASYWFDPNMALTGGYRYTKYSVSSNSGSEIDGLIWQGFTGGVAVSF